MLPFAARPAILAVTLCLSACGGDGADDLLQGCSPISGGGTTVAESGGGCIACGSENLAQAIDGNGATYATVYALSGSSGLRVHAQPGIVFAAGSVVGMVHSIAYDPAVFNGSLRTLMDGVPQETFTFNNGAGSGGNEPSRPGRVSYTTALQYNGVEFVFTGTSAGRIDARIHEFCSN